MDGDITMYSALVLDKWILDQSWIASALPWATSIHDHKASMQSTVIRYKMFSMKFPIICIIHIYPSIK
jgi:hypothetical protein